MTYLLYNAVRDFDRIEVEMKVTSVTVLESSRKGEVYEYTEKGTVYRRPFDNFRVEIAFGDENWRQYLRSGPEKQELFRETLLRLPGVVCAEVGRQIVFRLSIPELQPGSGQQLLITTDESAGQLALKQVEAALNELRR